MRESRECPLREEDEKKMSHLRLSMERVLGSRHLSRGEYGSEIRQRRSQKTRYAVLLEGGTGSLLEYDPQSTGELSVRVQPGEKEKRKQPPLTGSPSSSRSERKVGNEETDST